MGEMYDVCVCGGVCVLVYACSEDCYKNYTCEMRTL